MKRSYPFSSEFNDNISVREFQLPITEQSNHLDHTYAKPHVQQHFELLEESMREILTEANRTWKSIWCQLKIKLLFIKEEPKQDEESYWFNFKKFYINEENDVNLFIEEMNQFYFQRIDEFQQRGSGWKFKTLQDALIKVSKFRPLQGSSYLPTPKKLAGKRAIVNVQNTDHDCFKWSIVSALFPADINVDRVSNYLNHASSINTESIPFPTPLDKRIFMQFLKQNPSIHLNVFLFDADDGILPYFIDPNKPQEAIDLLFLPHTDSASGHYTWIKHFSRLLHDVTKHVGKKYVCRRCFYWSSFHHCFEQHLRDCDRLTSEDGVKKLVPHCSGCPSYDSSCNSCLKEATLEFRNYKAQQRIPAFIVADFESYLKPLEENNRGLVHHHQPISFGIKVVIARPYRDLQCFRKYVNQAIIVKTNQQDLSKQFMESTLKLGDELYSIICNEHQLIQWNEQDKKDYQNNWTCHICQKEIKFHANKVADHCHLTGNYRGPAHFDCNINYNYKNLQIPVLVHNFRGYDSKLILQDLGKLEHESLRNLCITAQNSEQFKSISVRHVRFIDSFLHLPSSLSQLVKNLAAEVKQDIIQAKKVFHHLAREFEHVTNEAFSLLLRKGVFPYTWLDCPEKLREKQLPGKQDFFNDLTQEDITAEDYTHAQNIWSTFQIETFQDYLELYLKTDVLLLADIIDNYQEVSLKAYGLDPIWFLTAPALSLNAALKMTGISLQLLTDMNMIHFFQRGIHGGMSYISKRKSVANLPNLQGFNPNMPHQSIFYTDCNNLYGEAMSRPMPTGGFKWIQPEELIEKEKSLSSTNWTELLMEIESWSTNYVLEVNATFPETVHDKMSDFPFLPENFIPPKGKQPKLINHLGDRERYVLSFEMYVLAKFEGVEFNKIHRVLEYEQSTWLAPYIMFNTSMRKQATTRFEQDYYKLMNNSVFGKFVEDVTKYVNFELFTSTKSKKYKKLHHRQPYKIKRTIVYHHCSNHGLNPTNNECPYGDSCVVGVERKRQQVTLNKPIYVGFKVLEISKLIMYQIFYHIFQLQFGSRMKLLAHDTDSFILEIQSENLQEEILNIKHYLDLSNYSIDHPLFDNTNKKVPGKMKNEYPDQLISKFIGLRSKCYCLQVANKTEKKAKGVKQYVIKKDLSIEEYEACLNESKPAFRQIVLLQSRQQKVYTMKQNKLCLSAQDDKRFILSDNISTLPWGHYCVPESNL